MQQEPIYQDDGLGVLITEIFEKDLSQKFNEWYRATMDDTTIEKVPVCRGGQIVKEPKEFVSLTREWLANQE